MSQEGWGGVTSKKSGGTSDPNILELKQANRIKLLEPSARRWRQHGITSPKDDDQFRSVVCPRGADGRDPAECPLCRKPTDPDGKQRFAVSRRFATNVWDYESGSVKVLIAGPQVFEEFDASAAVGMDPTETDWLIHKMGSGLQTTYKIVRGNPTPLPESFEPSQLHDLDKYEAPPSVQQIFETLEAVGIDYDSLETPSLTLEEAEQFQMPYGKHKGLTVEQLVANDADYAQFIHKSKLEQGSLGDMVFIALQTVLEHEGLVGPVDGVEVAPARPTTSAAGPSASASSPAAASPGPDETQLIPPGGGDPQTFSGDAVTALLAAGWEEYRPEQPAERQPPADTEIVEVSIAGQAPTGLPYANAVQILQAGTPIEFKDSFVDGCAQRALGYNNDAPPNEPAGDEQVALTIGGVDQVLPYSAAKGVVASGAGQFVSPDIQAAYEHHNPADGDRPTQASSGSPSATTPTSDSKSSSTSSTETPGSAVSLDPSLTSQGADGRWHHPALDAEKPDGYASKGAATQALNRRKAQLPAAAPGAPAVTQTNGGAPESGKEAKLNRCRQLLSEMPEIQSDYKRLLGIFEDVAGKRQITDFTDAELDALAERLEQEKAAA